MRNLYWRKHFSDGVGGCNFRQDDVVFSTDYLFLDQELLVKVENFVFRARFILPKIFSIVTRGYLFFSPIRRLGFLFHSGKWSSPNFTRTLNRVIYPFPHQPLYPWFKLVFCSFSRIIDGPFWEENSWFRVRSTFRMLMSTVISEPPLTRRLDSMGDHFSCANWTANLS